MLGTIFYIYIYIYICNFVFFFEGPIFGGAFLRRGLCLPFLLCFPLYSRANCKYKPPGGAYIPRGDVTEGFLRYDSGGLIFGGAYLRNFTVFQ